MNSEFLMILGVTHLINNSFFFVVGFLLLNKHYSMTKYIAVLCITIGICLATWATNSCQPSTGSSLASLNVTAGKEGLIAPKQQVAVWERLVGIGMLTYALFGSALLGINQEKMYAKFGKHPHEALFFIHALSLPVFIFMWTDIYKHAKLFQASPALNMPIFSRIVRVPCMWVWLLGNIVTQLICIKVKFDGTSLQSI